MTKFFSYRSIVNTAWVTGLFSVAVGLVLAALVLFGYPKLALDDVTYLQLHERQADARTDAALQDEIRTYDVALRQWYFRRASLIRRGGYVLAMGVVATGMLLHTAATMRRRLPHPSRFVPGGSTVVRQSHLARVSLITGAAAVVVLACGARWLALHRLPADVVRPVPIAAADDADAVEDATGPAEAAAPLPITPEQMAQNWHRFRGMHGAGICTFAGIPTEWNGAEGEGVLWKVPIPSPGASSPIVWEDRVFVTGATTERREVLCYAMEDGKLLWSKTVSEGPPMGPEGELEVDEATGFAASSPTTDGHRVFAMFATGDLAAFDLEGNLVWSKSLGVPENMYGHASSLDCQDGKLIIQLDQGMKDDDRSRLLALDCATGDVVWEAPRAFGSSWSSPAIVEFDGEAHILTCVEPWVIAYHLDDGRELWRAACLKGDVAPSPVAADGVVYVANDSAVVAAIRDGGQGDVTETNILWTSDYSLPDICSPLVANELLLIVNSYGGLAGYDREQGGEEPLWEHELDEVPHASPSLVGEYVYLIAENGDGWVLRVGRDGVEQIATNQLGEHCVASPAFQPGKIILRGEEHLFCIGDASSP